MFLIKKAMSVTPIALILSANKLLDITVYQVFNIFLFAAYYSRLAVL